MKDPRHPAMLDLIATWEGPVGGPLREHLGLTPGEFDAWKRDGSLPASYAPRAVPPGALDGMPAPPRLGRPPGGIGARLTPEVRARIFDERAAGATFLWLQARYSASQRTIARVIDGEAARRSKGDAA